MSSDLKEVHSKQAIWTDIAPTSLAVHVQECPSKVKPPTDTHTHTLDCHSPTKKHVLWSPHLVWISRTSA